MKKARLFLLSASLICALASCSSNEQEEQSRIATVDGDYTISENFEDLSFSASELSYWLSYNKGKAEMDGNKIKISTTSEYYGGIRSLYKTKIDFSKQVYLNFKGFESANANVTMMIKMVFHDYSKSDSAYITSNDFIGLNGDFSLNLENALLRYHGSVSNMELFKNDELIFKNKEVGVSFYISCFNNSDSGLSNDLAWIKFESFDVSYEEEKAGGELGCFSVSNDGINVDGVSSSNVLTRNKNDEVFQVKPTLNSVALDPKEAIFASSLPEKVVINSEGKISFKGVTKNTARVVSYPRCDIALGGIYDYSASKFSKNSGFYVNVLGLWQGDAVYSNVLGLFSASDTIDSDSNLMDLFEGNLLAKQKIAATNTVSSLNLVVSSNTLSILNNYLGSEEEKKEAETNGRSYTVDIALGNDDYVATTEGKVSVINCSGDKLKLISKEHVYATNDTFSIKANYLNEDYSRYSSNDKYLILWDDGVSKKYSYFTTSVIDAKEITKLTPSDIAKSFGTDRSWDGLTTDIVDVDGTDVFRMNLTLRDLTAYYAAPFLELYADMYSKNEKEYIKIDFTKNVKLMIDFGECSNINYNLRFYRIAGRYVDEYWRDEGANYTDLQAGNQFMLVDLHHYATKGNIPGMINLTISKSLPVEFGFDIALLNRNEVGNEGHLDIKNIYVLYE